MAKILDIPSIQKSINTKHAKFIKKFGNAYHKAIADHDLNLNIIISKIKCICGVFIDEKVINEAIQVESNPFKTIRLLKNGNSSYIDITTNGNDISICGYTFDIKSTSSIFNDDFILFKNVNNDEFDWKNFSISLLDYIHLVIYRRKSVLEINIDLLSK